MVFIATTANSQQPPEPPPQHNVLVDVHPQDHAISQFGNNVYPQDPAMHQYGNEVYPQDPATHQYGNEVYPQDPAMHQYGNEVYPQHPAMHQYGNDVYPQTFNTGTQYPTVLQNQAMPQVSGYPAISYAEVCPPVSSTAESQMFSYPTYGYSVPAVPQNQVYTSVPETSLGFPINNLFSAGHSDYDVNNSAPASQLGADPNTNPFLPNSDSIPQNPFINPSQADPIYPITPSTFPHPGSDTCYTVPQGEFLSGFNNTAGDQNTYSEKCFANQQPIFDLGGVKDNAVVHQEYSALPVDNSGYQTEPQLEDLAKEDSDESMESTSDIYNSAYTDTITSVDSTQYLIKPSDSDEDTLPEEEVKEIYYNAGYSLTTSAEIHLKQDDAGTVADVVACEDDATKEEEPLLEAEDPNESAAKEENNADNQDAETNPATHLQQIEEYVHHHLVPIAENEVLSLKIEEIEPSSTPYIPSSPLISHAPYGKITNNLTVADESFLFQSQSSLWDPDTGKQGKRAATMQNLHERSSFLDLTDVARLGRACQRALIYLKDDLTFGSLMSLNNMAAKNFTDPTQAVSLIEGGKHIDIIPSTKHRKNVIALSICITLLFIAMGSVRNLQSSLNQEGGVGIISMAVSFVGYMLGSIFSASIVQTFQPRKCIIINLIPNLMYVAANIYPTIWLMAPVSLIQGISLAIIWNAMSTYITFLSRGRALKKDEDFERVSSNFFGIFCLIYQSYHIIGNLIASLVLMPGRGPTATSLIMNATFLQNTTNVTDVTTIASNSQSGVLFELDAPLPIAIEVDAIPKAHQNVTLMDVTHLRLCGAEFCNHYQVGGSAVSVSDETKYLLFGIYMACIIAAMGIAMFWLEPLNERLFSSTVSPTQKIKQQLLSLSKFATDVKFLLLMPLLMFSVMQFGFISGEVTMAFITCPIGVHMVGYTMICFGVCASVTSYISGLLCKWTGRMPLIIIAKKSYQTLRMVAQEFTVRFPSSDPSVIMSDRLCDETTFMVCLT